MPDDTLLTKKCVPCEEKKTPFTEIAAREKLKGLALNWELLLDPPRIICTFTFPDFRNALVFVNKIGDLAEREGHHPDIALSWGKVLVTLFTHSINGLSENDFILARKIETLPIE